MPSLAQHEQKPNHFFSPILVGAIIAVLLALGVFFRFADLDKKIYWPDEVITSFRISGYSAEELTKTLLGGRELTVRDIQKYQHINPGKKLLPAIASLAIEDPKQPQLYFILARLWAESFGDSMRAIRRLSALISVFIIPSLYWLCRELFDSRLTASMAIALLLVSPFHVLYAHEAHPYSLLILTALLSSAALLRAMRLKTGRSWTLYVLTLLCGIWTHNLFGVIAVAHGTYVMILKKVALKKCSPYLVARLATLAAFLPWCVWILFGIAPFQNRIGGITAAEAGLLDGLKRWSLVFRSLSIDTGGAHVLNRNYGLENLWILLIQLPVLLLIGYSFYFLYHKSSTRIWVFVFALTGSSVISFVFSDLALGRQTLDQPRFLSTYYLAILLSVAYFLATQIVSSKVSKRRVWQTLTVILISSGIASCAISFWAAAWNKSGAAYATPEVAQLINESTRPLLMATLDGPSFINLFSLSYVLDPKVRIRLIADSGKLEIPDGYSDVFLINSSENLRQRVEKGGYRMESVPGSELWHLVRKP